MNKDITPRDVCRALLLFHSGGPWTAERRVEWNDLIGEREATTRILCDAARQALATALAPTERP